MPSVLHPDRFSPVLLNSTSLNVSLEQRNIIKDILDTSCSDSAFAKKAYDAIIYTLVAGSVNPVKATSLNPSSALLGDPSFTLRVVGSGFDRFTKIVFAGHDEPTTYVSPTEVTTGVDMSVWKGADVVPVYVESPVVASDPLMFTFTDPNAPGVLKTTSPVHAQSVPPVQPPVKPVAKTVEVKSDK